MLNFDFEMMIYDFWHERQQAMYIIITPWTRRKLTTISNPKPNPQEKKGEKNYLFFSFLLFPALLWVSILFSEVPWLLQFFKSSSGFGQTPRQTTCIFLMHIIGISTTTSCMFWSFLLVIRSVTFLWNLMPVCRLFCPLVVDRMVCSLFPKMPKVTLSYQSTCL